MAEKYFNLFQTTVAVGGYTSGSGVLNVASTTGITLGGSDTCRMLVYRVISGLLTPIVLLTVTAVNSSTQFAVTAEGADANALQNDVVENVLSTGGQDQIRKDLSQIGVYSSIPTSGKVGDIYRASDSAYVLRWNGTSFDAFGPIFEVIPPVDSTYTTYLSGGSPVKVDKGAVLLSGGTSDSMYRGKTMGVTIPYTAIDLGFTYTLDVVNNGSFGMFIRESSSGKIIVWYVVTGTSPNTAQLQINQLNSDGSFHSNIHNSAVQALAAIGKIYLRIVNDNSNRLYYHSQTPIGPWQFFFSETTGTYLTENQWGFFTGGIGGASSGLVFHLKETQ